jgi:hypothetical protein
MAKADDLFRKSTTGKKAIANTTDSIGAAVALEVHKIKKHNL